MHNRLRGLTLVELLASTVIATLTLVVGANAWGYCMTISVQQHQTSVGSQLARADIERAKVLGWANLPLGTLSGTTATHTGALEYFNAVGAPLANSTGAIFSVQRTVTDTGITVNGTTYTLNATSKRTVTATVRTISPSKAVVSMATVLAKDGV